VIEQQAASGAREAKQGKARPAHTMAAPCQPPARRDATPRADPRKARKGVPVFVHDERHYYTSGGAF